MQGKSKLSGSSLRPSGGIWEPIAEVRLGILISRIVQTSAVRAGSWSISINGLMVASLLKYFVIAPLRRGISVAIVAYELLGNTARSFGRRAR
jgi:hypothetical protein